MSRTGASSGELVGWMKPHVHIFHSWLMSSWNSNGGIQHDILEVGALPSSTLIVSYVYLVVGNSATFAGIISSPPDNMPYIIDTSCCLVARMQAKRALHPLFINFLALWMAMKLPPLHIPLPWNVSLSWCERQSWTFCFWQSISSLCLFI